MRQRARRRPSPGDRSIHWKPVRDSHYIVASLQPDHGGREELYVDQLVLLRVQELARGVPGRYVIGLLLGGRFECADDRSKFMLVDSLVESPSPLDEESALPAALANVVSQFTPQSSTEILGWYCSDRLAESRFSRTHEAVHTGSFHQRWHTALIVGEGATSGAFFLRDRSASRWFRTPFFEVTPASIANAPKSTCISWGEYLTTDSVAPLGPTSHSTVAAQITPHVATERRPSLWHSLFASSRVRKPEAVLTAPAPKNSAQHAPQIGLNAPLVRPAIRRKPDPHPTPPPRTSVRLITDADDTSISDTPDRYIELARADGFFVTATFDGANPSEQETLWVLNEPYSGLLITMVSDESRVIDASLHYNLHSESADLLQRSFPEHRDSASGTLYVRESCVERLRARCRSLRATGALEPQWKVAPAIYFLTPAEWDSSTSDFDGSDGGSSALQELNRRRVNSLAESIRRQFCLTPDEDPPTETAVRKSTA